MGFLTSQKSRWRRSGEIGAGFLVLHSQSPPVFTGRIYSELSASIGTVLWDRFVDAPACCLKVCPNTCCSLSKLCPTLCDLMDYSTPGFPILHHLPELAQTHVHWVGDAIQPPAPLLPPSPFAISFSQHQGLFQWVGSSIRWPKYWSFRWLYFFLCF